MMGRTLLFCLLFSLIRCNLYAQNENLVQSGYFINPLDIPLRLSGNFGELRSNHFHSGLDFKTNGKEGYSVKAIADGYISRIKVSAYGYGNALYITHDNGYVSVYGHLQKFDTVFTKYVRLKQYELKSFEVDLFPKKNELKVKQGQIIALSGNTGGSAGPHLHFEVRDGKTEEIINPFQFGYKVDDTDAPSIDGIAAYPLDSSSTINGKKAVQYFGVKKGVKNQYTLTSVPEISGRVGWSIMSFDTETDNTNKNGTYSYTLQMDSLLLFSYRIDRFAFDKTRYVNAHIDYSKYQKSNVKYQRCYVLPGNKFNAYQNTPIEQLPVVNDTLMHYIKIEAFDYFKNKNSLEFKIKGNKYLPGKEKPVTDNYFYYNKTNSFKADGIEISLPLNCLYDNINFYYSKKNIKGNFYADVYQIHNDETPVHNPYTISIKPFPEALKYKDKLVVVSIDKDNKTTSEGGEFNNGFVTAKVKKFGVFTLLIDTVSPNARIVNFDKSTHSFKNNLIVVKISDNLSGIKSYSGNIDGVWVLMQHDGKAKTLTYEFDDKLKKTKGEHTFSLVLTDNKGNSIRIDNKFIY